VKYWHEMTIDGTTKKRRTREARQASAMTVLPMYDLSSRVDRIERVKPSQESCSFKPSVGPGIRNQIRISSMETARLGRVIRINCKP